MGWRLFKPKKRIDNHERAGFTFISAMQGERDDESMLKSCFQPKLCDKMGTETFVMDKEICDYISILISYHWASTDIKEVETLPRLPMVALNPRTIKLPKIGNKNVNGALFHLPASERITMTARNAHLSSTTDEWITDKEIIESARNAMGTIDLDPASSFLGQQTVKAKTWYGREQNGLSEYLPWFGNVWLNPPYGKSKEGANGFLSRLIKEIETGNVKQAITCVNLNTAASLWFHDKFLPLPKVHLISRGRRQFLFYKEKLQRKGNPNGSLLSYFGEQPKIFLECFKHIGTGIFVHKIGGDL